MLQRPLEKNTKKLVASTNYRLMQVKSIAECSKGSILQYLRPSLSYHLSLFVFEWPFKTGSTVFNSGLNIKVVNSFESWAIFYDF